MTPDGYREFAALMESEGPGALRDMLTEHPARFWDFFGRFADPGLPRRGGPRSDAASLSLVLPALTAYRRILYV